MDSTWLLEGKWSPLSSCLTFNHSVKFPLDVMKLGQGKWSLLDIARNIHRYSYFPAKDEGNQWPADPDCMCCCILQTNFGLGHLEPPLGPMREQKLSVSSLYTVILWWASSVDMFVCSVPARVLKDNFRHRYFTRVDLTGAWISPSCLQTSPNQCQMQIFSSFSFVKISAITASHLKNVGSTLRDFHWHVTGLWSACDLNVLIVFI